MEHIRGILLAILLLVSLSPTAQGAEDPGWDALPRAELEQAAGEYAPSMPLDQDIDLDLGLRDLVDTGTEQLFGVVRTALKSGSLLLAVTLFCAVADGAWELGGASGLGGTSVRAAPMVGVLAVCAIAVADVHSLMGLGQAAIQRVTTFGGVLLPALAAAAAAGGTPASAAARHGATVLFSNVLFQLIDKVLIPLTYAFVAAAAVSAALDNPGLKRVAGTIKGVVTGTLTAVMLIFVSYLSVSGVIAGTADAITLKTAKFAISGSVPVVGGVLSDAAETVLAGAGLLRNAVGVFGMLVVLGVCLTPFLRLGVHYLVYKLTAALCATVSDGKLTGLIDAIGGAFALELGMVGCCAVMLLICVISCLSATGAV